MSDPTRMDFARVAAVARFAFVEQELTVVETVSLLGTLAHSLITKSNMPKERVLQAIDEMVNSPVLSMHKIQL